MNRPELLAPAGSLLKLKTAADYGADAVYAAGKNFGLRTASENLTEDELAQGAKYLHDRGAKLYVPLNIYPRSAELAALPDYIKAIEKSGADAVIVSDPGVFTLVKKYAPRLDIHVSTQANTVNYEAARFWVSLGANRIVLARELSLKEIALIHEKIKADAEIEVFVHGAMCVSYSGRCLLSNYMAGRDSNRGDCAQPCRWKYALTEEKRPGEYFPIEEDERGAYIMNSKDLCLIRRIPELISAGVSSFKIEGRVKSEFYVATVVGAYRRAIDRYLKDAKGYVFDEADYQEILKVSHREYFEGFIDGAVSDSQSTESGGYIRGYQYAAFVEGYDADNKLIIATQRSKVERGDELELLMPGGVSQKLKAERIYDEQMNPIESTPHPMQKIYIPFEKEVPSRSFIRKRL